MYDQRPWFVNGLNFFLIPWAPLFDPYGTAIIRVDNGLEYLDFRQSFGADYLSELLQHVARVIKLTKILSSVLRANLLGFMCIFTTLSLFRVVCVARLRGGWRFPLIYEGLYKMCPLCGGNSHQLLTCPNLLVFNKVEVFVERFDASRVTLAHYAASVDQNLSKPNET